MRTAKVFAGSNSGCVGASNMKKKDAHVVVCSHAYQVAKAWLFELL
jgi:hypothetical protein